MEQKDMDILMSVSKAHPERYIKTTSSAVIALVKVIEGFIAYGYLRILFYCLKALFIEKKLLFPTEFLEILLPNDIFRLLPVDAIPDIGLIVTRLCAAAAVFITVLLICIMLEGVLSVTLRFFLKGSRILKYTHIAVTVSMLALTLITGAFLAIHAFHAFRHFSTASKSSLPVQFLFVTFLCALMLLLLTSYHIGAARILSAISYECRTGLKQTEIKKVRLARDTLILAILYIAAAVALGFRIGWSCTTVYFLALLAGKHFAVYSSWMDFRFRHM